MIILLTNLEILYLTFGVSLGAILILIAIFFTLRYFKKKKEIKINVEEKHKKDIVFQDENELFNLFGGRDNIVNVELKGSRLNIELKDTFLFKKEDIKNYFIENILIMSNKVVLIGSGVESLFNQLKSN